MLSVNHLYLMKHRVRETGFNWSKTALVVGILIILPILGSSFALGQTVPNRGPRDLTGGVQGCCQDCETRGGQCPGGEDDFSPSGRP